MTAGSKSQLKANDNRTGCVSRKFMLAGTAAWISALIIFSAGHTLNNIEHVHLLKATLAFKELVATNICRRADAEPSTPPSPCQTSWKYTKYRKYRFHNATYLHRVGRLSSKGEK
jgi:hypothetical protein